MSKYLPLDLRSQSYGDRALLALKGERRVWLEVALKGESPPVKAGDCGILRRPNLPVDGAEAGKTKWEVVAAEVGDLWLSQLHEQSLCSLEPVEGAEVGVVLPDDLLSPAVGLCMVLRKSVYAVGGVMGVLMDSSCLMKKSAYPGRGDKPDRADSSEGNVEVIGVLSCASLGFVETILTPCRD
jgi:hypothetical protein